MLHSEKQCFNGGDITVAVVGMGYVGLSIATLLSRRHKVYAVDIVKEKTDQINRRKSPIKDEYIERYFAEEELNLFATQDMKGAVEKADFVVIAVPTSYDENNKKFDTSIVENTVSRIAEYNPLAVVVIKSTIPIGFMEELSEKSRHKKLLFSPEFLRESKALYDNLYPSRIIVGVPKGDGEMYSAAECFAEMLSSSAIKKDVPIMITGYAEAEAIKLFSNTYLAMRVAFFNELDTYAESHGLDTSHIIKGVSLDERIGFYYNNPSFGYGGYCLPKDTKQCLANFDGVPQNLIGAIVDSNDTRKAYIADRILEKLSELCGEDKPCTVGVFRLIMKNGSDNFRDSAIGGVIGHLIKRGVRVILFEPMLNGASSYGEIPLVNDWDRFRGESDLVIANRFDPCLKEVESKLYTRDIFNRD